MSALALADAKAYLNITGSELDSDIQAVINSAEAVIGQRTGPLVPTVVTRRVNGSTGSLALPITPVIDLTSVTPYQATAMDISTLYVDQNSGLVTTNTLVGFPALYYDVVYNAGRTTCPDDLLYAVKELVRHLFQPRRGPRAMEPTADARAVDSRTPGAAYLLPYRISELIAPHTQVPAG